MADAPSTPRIHCLLAEFVTTRALYHACEAVRDAGYTRWDAHTPFPVHGLDRAMGLRRSRLPFIVLVMALLGAACGFGLQVYTSVIDYPWVVSGKPHLSWPAFVPITFEVAVLFGALGAVLGMLGLNRLPQYHHPLFNSTRFERATDDRFFIALETADPRYDEAQAIALLRRAGATYLERIEE